MFTEFKTHENPASIKKAKQTNEIYTSTRLQKMLLIVRLKISYNKI